MEICGNNKGVRLHYHHLVYLDIQLVCLEHLPRISFSFVVMVYQMIEEMAAHLQYILCSMRVITTFDYI